MLGIELYIHSIIKLNECVYEYGIVIELYFSEEYIPKVKVQILIQISILNTEIYLFKKERIYIATDTFLEDINVENIVNVIEHNQVKYVVYLYI